MQVNSFWNFCNCFKLAYGRITKSFTFHSWITISFLYLCPFTQHLGFPHGTVGEESTCNAGDAGWYGFDPWVRKIPWRKEGQSTLVFLPEKSHGERSMLGYSQKGHRELDTTEWASMHACTQYLLCRAHCPSKFHIHFKESYDTLT